MAKLPVDLIGAEILPKLSAKSVTRFKCVSKSFQTLISSRAFVDSHIRQSLSSDTNRFILLINNFDRDIYSFDLDTPNSKAVALPLFELDIGHNCFVLGSCNGLVCFRLNYSIHFGYILFNPSIGFYKEIAFETVDEFCSVQGLIRGEDWLRLYPLQIK